MIPPVEFDDGAKILKALSEPARLRILYMLSCGELCACEILKGLSITQPTLSHHMKTLIDCGLVLSRKSATWMYYSVDPDRVRQIQTFLGELTIPKAECPCFLYAEDCESS